MSERLIYFRDGKLVAEQGQARVYKMEGKLYLEIGEGHRLWTFEDELQTYINQIYDKPKGNCLEIGLGLGVASKYILSCPKVATLTTIEINADVIAVQKKVNRIRDKRHTIIHADGLTYIYETAKKYDFIFIDCYDVINEDSLPLIADLVYAGQQKLNSDGEILGWFDEFTPRPDAIRFFSLFQ